MPAQKGCKTCNGTGIATMKVRMKSTEGILSEFPYVCHCFKGDRTKFARHNNVLRKTEN